MQNETKGKVEWLGDKNATHCKTIGCFEKHDFDSRYCVKHLCVACYGTGYHEPLVAVRVRCYECGGSGEKKHAK